MSVLPILPVPILHLGIVSHTWSSHLAQGCYMINNLAELRIEPLTCLLSVPCSINLATMCVAQLVYIIHLEGYL